MCQLRTRTIHLIILRSPDVPLAMEIELKDGAANFSFLLKTERSVSDTGARADSGPEFDKTQGLLTGLIEDKPALFSSNYSSQNAIHVD